MDSPIVYRSYSAAQTSGMMSTTSELSKTPKQIKIEPLTAEMCWLGVRSAVAKWKILDPDKDRNLKEPSGDLYRKSIRNWKFQKMWTPSPQWLEAPILEIMSWAESTWSYSAASWS